jgi:hypothetical protein
MPGQLGTVMTLDNVSGLFGKFLPLGFGFAVQAFGLQWPCGFLLAGLVILMLPLPPSTSNANRTIEG